MCGSCGGSLVAGFLDFEIGFGRSTDQKKINAPRPAGHGGTPIDCVDN